MVTLDGPASACQGLTSNPGLEAGNQTGQVLAILTFNVSSQATLDDLLGGLLLNASGNVTGSLLNASGNVTGSLLNVTAELPTLGFSLNVLDALANRALPNVGAFGEPSSTFTPPPPPCSGNQCLWNAVSGVIHIALGIFSVAWNAAVAAATYFAQVAAAVSNALGISGLVNQLVSTLKAVASAMEQALEALAAYLKALALVALGALLSPLIRSLSSYGDKVATDFATVEGDVRVGTPVPEAATQALLSDFAGPVFYLMVGLGIAIPVIYFALEGLSFGSLTFVTAIVSVMIGILATALLAFLGKGVLSAVFQGGALAVHAIEGLFNSSHSLSVPNGPSSARSPSTTSQLTFCDVVASWNAFANTLALESDALDLGLLSYTLFYVYTSPLRTLTLATIGTSALFVMAFEALLFDSVAIAEDHAGNFLAAVGSNLVAITFGVLGFVDFFSLKAGFPQHNAPPLEGVDNAAQLLDGIAAEIGAAQLGTDLGAHFSGSC